MKKQQTPPPPRAILPDALGLEWGMSKEECLAKLDVVPKKQTPDYAIVELLIQDSSYEIDLDFDNDEKLERIEIYLYVSRDFWNADWTYEEMERIHDEFEGHYDRLVEQYSSILGPPDFSSDWGVDGYPEYQGTGNLVYWNNPAGRIQVEFDHQDKEAPVWVRLVCYPV